MNPIILAAGCSLITAVVCTWLVRRLALTLGILDRPDGVRKLQQQPVPLLGGIAVFGAWVMGMFASSATVCALVQHGPLFPLQIAKRLLSAMLAVPDDLRPTLTIAAVVILAIGILDDRFSLKPRWKLLGQVCAASILVAGGLAIERLWLFGHTFELGWLGIVVTLLWLVGSMNAVNMLDGLDGLASTVGLIICLSLAAMAWIMQNPALVLVSLALAGALAGFLCYNLPPARIYLGDSGSNLIGLVIGAVAIKGSFKAPATAALAAPIAMLAIPIFDGVATVIRRRIAGCAVFSPDRGHIHHCLQERGWSNRQVLSGIGVLCAATGLASLASLYYRCETVAALATSVVVCVCLATRLFGYYECLLALRGFLQRPAHDRNEVIQQRLSLPAQSPRTAARGRMRQDYLHTPQNRKSA